MKKHKTYARSRLLTLRNSIVVWKQKCQRERTDHHHQLDHQEQKTMSLTWNFGITPILYYPINAVGTLELLVNSSSELCSQDLTSLREFSKTDGCKNYSLQASKITNYEITKIDATQQYETRLKNVGKEVIHISDIDYNGFVYWVVFVRGGSVLLNCETVVVVNVTQATRYVRYVGLGCVVTTNDKQFSRRQLDNNLITII